MTRQSRQSQQAINDEARARVIALFKQQGSSVADDARNFDAFLRDTFAGQFGWQRRALVAAAQEAIPARLRQSVVGGSGQRLHVSQIAEYLRTDAAIDANAARWSVETLAEALVAAQRRTEVDQEELPRTAPDAAGEERAPLASVGETNAARTGLLLAAGATLLALLATLFV